MQPSRYVEYEDCGHYGENLKRKIFVTVQQNSSHLKRRDGKVETFVVYPTALIIPILNPAHLSDQSRFLLHSQFSGGNKEFSWKYREVTKLEKCSQKRLATILSAQCGENSPLSRKKLLEIRKKAFGNSFLSS